MKAPRLKFFGIECSMEEVRVLRDMSHYADLDVGFVGRLVEAGEHPYPVKQPEIVEELVTKGLIVRSKEGHTWTKLGAMYMERLARDNKHLRFYMPWRRCSRPVRMARKKNKGLWKEAV